MFSQKLTLPLYQRDPNQAAKKRWSLTKNVFFYYVKTTFIQTFLSSGLRCLPRGDLKYLCANTRIWLLATHSLPCYTHRRSTTVSLETYLVQKYFVLMRNKNYLFISRSEKESHRGYSAISQEDRLIFFCFDYLPPLFATSSPHYPKVTKVVSPLHALFFLRGIKVDNQSGNGGPILPARDSQDSPYLARVANQNTGFALSCLRVLPAI